MPIYDYLCSGCGRSFEAVIEPDEQVICPECASKDVHRQLSSPGRVGLSSKGGGLQCGRTTTCCGSTTPCDKPGCHK